MRRVTLVLALKTLWLSTLSHGCLLAVLKRLMVTSDTGKTCVTGLLICLEASLTCCHNWEKTQTQLQRVLIVMSVFMEDFLERGEDEGFISSITQSKSSKTFSFNLTLSLRERVPKVLFLTVAAKSLPSLFFLTNRFPPPLCAPVHCLSTTPALFPSEESSSVCSCFSSFSPLH